MRAPRTIRLIGFSTFHAEYADLSRSEFLKLAHGGTFGAVARHGRKVMVAESAVRAWVQARCRTMRIIVQERTQTKVSRRGRVEGQAQASQGGLRPVAMNTLVPAGTLDEIKSQQSRGGGSDIPS